MTKLLVPVETTTHNKGGVVLYDVDKNKIIKEYIHSRQDGFTKRLGWRGGVLYKNKYLITTDWTHLHYFDIYDWKVIRSVTYNTFNDLHYLQIINHENDEYLYIANTGIDAIERLRNPLNIVNKETFFVFDLNERFEKRKIDLNHKWNNKYKTSPHVAHPNCITPYKDHIFITCFEDSSRKNNTGCVVDFTTGKILIDKKNCHDGNIDSGNFYIVESRENKLLTVNNFRNKKWPANIDEEMKIRNKGWWRGMIINKGKLYLFSSKNYKSGHGPAKLAVCNLRNKSKTWRVKEFPGSSYKWENIYEPVVFES